MFQVRYSPHAILADLTLPTADGCNTADGCIAAAAVAADCTVPAAEGASPLLLLPASDSPAVSRHAVIRAVPPPIRVSKEAARHLGSGRGFIGHGATEKAARSVGRRRRRGRFRYVKTSLVNRRTYDRQLPHGRFVRRSQRRFLHRHHHKTKTTGAVAILIGLMALAYE